MSARDLLAAATPRPWTSCGGCIDGPEHTDVVAVHDLPAHAYPELQSGHLILTDADRKLIVAAVNEYEALLDLEECWRAWLRDEQVETAAVRDTLHRLNGLRRATA